MFLGVQFWIKEFCQCKKNNKCQIKDDHQTLKIVSSLEFSLVPFVFAWRYWPAVEWKARSCLQKVDTLDGLLSRLTSCFWPHIFSKAKSSSIVEDSKKMLHSKKLNFGRDYIFAPLLKVFIVQTSSGLIF